MQSDNGNGTLLLDARDIAELLDYPSCIAAVEDAFRRQGKGELQPAAICGLSLSDGEFHIKAATIHEPRPYFVAKTNANFPINPARHSLPTIQGLVLLFDASRSTPLAVMESAELTLRRTASATAIAARYLARSDARTMVPCGGSSGCIHARGGLAGAVRRDGRPPPRARCGRHGAGRGSRGAGGRGRRDAAGPNCGG